MQPRQFNNELQMDVVPILMGEHFATAENVAISTVLGSCVSACLWDPGRGLGGMNHFMLPGDDSRAQAMVSVSARYGVFAMEVLINDLIKLGAERRRLVAKVFGGGRVMKGAGSLDVGAKNSEFVLEFLKVEGILLAARDLLDSCARKVYFFPKTGKVLVKKMRVEAAPTVLREEREYLATVGNRIQSGEVEIFRKPR
jgi:chemotaxis protein CheD